MTQSLNWDTDIYNELIHAMTNLEEEKILTFMERFLEGNPCEEEEISLMNALRAGIDGVVTKFEMKIYTTRDLIYTKQILSNVMDMIAMNMQVNESS